MNETLQQKIDAIWHDIEYMDCIREIEINKALQEFREQIRNRYDLIAHSKINEHHKNGYENALRFVLSLIGE